MCKFSLYLTKGGGIQGLCSYLCSYQVTGFHMVICHSSAETPAQSGCSTTNTLRVFHVETTWKRRYPRRFNVEYTWCAWRVVWRNIAKNLDTFHLRSLTHLWSMFSLYRNQPNPMHKTEYKFFWPTFPRTRTES